MAKKSNIMEEKIKGEVREAMSTTGKVRITFKKRAIGALDILCGMERRGEIFMSDSCAAILSAAKRKQYWGHSSNRITTIGLGINFNHTEFARSLAKAIEDIQAVEKAKNK